MGIALYKDYDIVYYGITLTWKMGESMVYRLRGQWTLEHWQKMLSTKVQSLCQLNSITYTLQKTSHPCQSHYNMSLI